MVNKKIISPLSPLPPAPPPLSLFYSHQTPLTLITKYIFYFLPRVSLSLRYLTRTFHIFPVPTQHFASEFSAFLCLYFSSFFALVLVAGFSIFLIGGSLLLEFYSTSEWNFSGCDGFP